MLMAVSTGHLGPTIYRSTDAGKTWKESSAPPAFRKVPEGEQGRSVNHVFWLTPCHDNEPDAWYAGTSPQGLFRSDNGGVTWAAFSYINEDPQYIEWMGTVQDGTPDGPKLHSIIVDPHNPKHLYFAMSGGGVHESVDGGKTFLPLIKGLEVVEGFDPATVTFHDPHCVRLCPSNPDRLYQQNHCGIYRLDRPSNQWVRDRQEHAQGDRRHRLPDGRSSPQCGCRLGVPHGRLDRVAAGQPRRETCRICDEKRREDLVPSREGFPAS